MTAKSPFLPVAEPVIGRKTVTNLFGVPEVPFPLLTKAQKDTIRKIRQGRAAFSGGRDLTAAFAAMIGVRLP
jgi:hypothetical protein